MATDIQLTDGQRRALAAMQQGGGVLLTGPAGTGKSTTLKYFLESLSMDSRPQVAVTATVGIAATLVGGTTIHSWFGVGTGDAPVLDLADKIMKSPFARARVRSAATLVVDEISMLSATLFDQLELIARLVRGDPHVVMGLLARWRQGAQIPDDELYAVRPGDEPFGGIQFIGVGDFAQIPPVDDALKKTTDGGESGRRDLFAFTARSWPRVVRTVVDLTEVMRQGDTAFVELLNAMRRGGPLTAGQTAMLNSRVFEDPAAAPPPAVEGMERTLLYSHREDVDHINTLRLKALAKMNAGMLSLPDDEFNDHAQAKAIKFPAIVTVRRRRSRRPHDDDARLKEIAVKRVPCSTSLIVAVGAQVMLVYNRDVKLGLANGSRGVVKRLVYDEHGVCVGVVVDFVTAKGVIVTAHEFEVRIDDNTKVVVQQIPLVLAYAMTIHKSIGATIDCVEADLGRCFEYGQAYTAMSRVRSLDDLVITALDVDKIKAHPLVKAFYGWDT